MINLESITMKKAKNTMENGHLFQIIRTEL